MSDKKREVHINVNPGGFGPALRQALMDAGWTGTDTGYGEGGYDIWLTPPDDVREVNVELPPFPSLSEIQKKEIH